MQLLKKVICLLPVVALAALPSNEAYACGGCFVPPEENTQVTGHRMVLSISKDASTLYDQIEYSGNPEEFGWVLPVKGEVEVTVAPDLFINQLGFDSAVTVVAPPLNCPIYNCPNDFGSTSSGGVDLEAGNASPGEDGVEVIAQETVGPYETVQLAATDPNALSDWLSGHGYNIPDDVNPVISAYVAENFNFLAMKLVPGVGIDKMQPVAITTPGANAALPLRMVAAGTGATTLLTLYVLSEGRYEPTSHPFFTMTKDEVVWNWDTSESNYTELRQSKYDDSDGFAWQVESSTDYSADAFRNNIHNVIDFTDPESAGYPDMTWEEAHAAADADLARLFGDINTSNLRLTRLRAELSRPSLAKDLTLSASDDQSTVSTVMQLSKSVGTPPACPPPPPGCFEDGSDGGSWTAPWAGSSSGIGGATCSIGQQHFDQTAFGMGLGFFLLIGLRRRRRARS